LPAAAGDTSPDGTPGRRSGRPGVPNPSLIPDDLAVPDDLARLLHEADLSLRLRGRTAQLWLLASARRNAQTPTTWRALAAACHWLDERVDVVVLRAEGPTFSAGLDRRAFTPAGIPGELSLTALAAADDDTVDSAIATFQQGFRCWREAGFVSLAVVQGQAIGAGFQLALACDLRLATPDAVFEMREPQLGLVPDLGGTAPLVAAVGYPRALDICATGRQVGAQQALDWGLVQDVVPRDELDEGVTRWVAALTTAPAAAVRTTRALLRHALTADPQAQLAAERVAQRQRLRALAG
jgi:enoyl-CoA hydratase/carnithine racemase